MTELSKAVYVLLAMAAIILIPAAITLSTVEDPGTLEITSSDPTPLGYTWSLLLFIVPLVTISLWFRRRPEYAFQRKSFWTTIARLVPLGFVLDLLFGNTFFDFPNRGAVLGIGIPAVGGEAIPIEEFAFYLTGFLVVLLLYIWNDEYWVAAYNVDYGQEAPKVRKLVQFHFPSICVGVVLLVTAVVYKKLFSEVPEGWPWYFTYLILASFIPSAGFLPSVQRFVNWRAFSLTFFMILLISLLWEATLGVPYGWWGYHHGVMMGIFIGAWRELPLEAVLAWLAVTYTTVIVFEVVKVWQASGKSARSAFFG
jgi:hypothetical protein